MSTLVEWIIGVVSYLFVGALTVSLDAYTEYRANEITSFKDYNRPLSWNLTLFWPIAWAYLFIAGLPAVLFWVLQQIGGNPFVNIGQAVKARRRQKGIDGPADWPQTSPIHQEFTD